MHVVIAEGHLTGCVLYRFRLVQIGIMVWNVLRV